MSTKILSVDDSKTIRMIINKAFKPFDCSLFEGANGEEGLAVAAREKPSLIILDITMPVMDGFETLTRLRADPALASTPVIMLTAEAGKDTVLRFAKLGVRDYIVKPFVESQVIERVRRVVPLLPKVEVVAQPKSVLDEVRLLVVEDKPAIVEQIRAGFANTPWKVIAAENSTEAVAAVEKSPIHVALISLSLPDSGATTLLRTLRASPRARTLPILGLAVRTATEEQARAQQAGFSGIVTKPIAFDELKLKICRLLSLDMSAQYFSKRDGAMVLTLPAHFNPAVDGVIFQKVPELAAGAVDSGLDRMIIDFSRLQHADLSLIKLVTGTLEICQKVGLKKALIGSEAVTTACRNFEETSSLTFAASFDEAMRMADAEAAPV